MDMLLKVLALIAGWAVVVAVIIAGALWFCRQHPEGDQ